MADTGVFATTGECQRKIGANASSTANVEAYINQFIAEAEAYINFFCNYDFTTNYASLSTIAKNFLRGWATAWVAMKVINYDESVFFTIAEAIDRKNYAAYEVSQYEKLASQQGVVTKLVNGLSS